MQDASLSSNVTCQSQVEQPYTSLALSFPYLEHILCRKYMSCCVRFKSLQLAQNYHYNAWQSCMQTACVCGEHLQKLSYMATYGHWAQKRSFLVGSVPLEINKLVQCVWGCSTCIEVSTFGTQGNGSVICKAAWILASSYHCNQALMLAW